MSNSRRRVLVAGGVALLLAAGVLASHSSRLEAGAVSPAVPVVGMERGAEAEPAPVGLDLFALMVGADTIPRIRYRVCKDLTICYLSFASPEPTIVAMPMVLTAPPLALDPVPVPERPVLAQEDTFPPLWVFGLPILAYPLMRDGDGGEGGGGGGSPEPEPGVPPVPRPPVEPESPPIRPEPGGPGGPGAPPVRPEGPGGPPEGPGSPPDGPPPGPVVPPTTTVPEPSGLLLMTTGLAGLAIYRRRAATARR